MKSTVKTSLIIVGALIAVILMVIGAFVSTNNKAVTLEEQINEATASIKVQEKRRVDLIFNLVDVVEEYAAHEKDTFTAIADARRQANDGDTADAQISLNAIAEAYPELKANENYKQLMTELAMTENVIAEHRNNLNSQVKSYNKFCRKFPSSIILNILGYEKITVDYTNWNVSEDAPQNLFGDK